MDPTRPATLYLAAYPGFLYTRASTAAATGARPARVSTTRYSSLAVDPARPSRVYAGTAGGFWRSVDGGATWQRASQGLPAGDQPGVTAVAALSRPAGTVLAGTARGGLFKSVDGGLTWAAAGRGLPAAGILALAVAPADRRTIYTSVQFSGVFRSTDGGATWKRTRGQPVAPFTLSLAVSPSAPRTLWAGTDTRGVFRSTDAGDHWTAAGPRATDAVPALAAAGPRVFAGVRLRPLDFGGVFASADGGATWQRRNQGLAALNAVSAAIDPRDGGVLWASLPDQGLFRSDRRGDDGRRRWARASLPPGDSPLKPSSPLGVAFNADGSALYLTTTDSPGLHVAMEDGGPRLPLDVARRKGRGLRSPLLRASGSRRSRRGLRARRRSIFASRDAGANWRALARATPAKTWTSPSPPRRRPSSTRRARAPAPLSAAGRHALRPLPQHGRRRHLGAGGQRACRHVHHRPDRLAHAGRRLGRRPTGIASSAATTSGRPGRTGPSGSRPSGSPT